MSDTYRSKLVNKATNFSEELYSFVEEEIELLDRGPVQPSNKKTVGRDPIVYIMSDWLQLKEGPVERTVHTRSFETEVPENEGFSWSRPKSFRKQGNRRRRVNNTQKLNKFVNMSYTESAKESARRAEDLVFEPEDHFWEWYW